MAEPAYRHDHDHLPARKDGRAWPAPGHWTYEDYRRLPDDGQRYEVIRGTLFVTGAPDYDHQYAIHQLHRLLGNPVAEQRLGVVLGAPFEILLPRGRATPVQPDILFFRTGNQPHPGAPRFEGVPDLIVEVLSPGTRRRDEGIKLETYEESGVPEYWLVDPRDRLVLVYVLTGGLYAELGRFAEGELVRSMVLPELRLRGDDLFPAPRRCWFAGREGVLSPIRSRLERSGPSTLPKAPAGAEGCSPGWTCSRRGNPGGPNIPSPEKRQGGLGA